MHQGANILHVNFFQIGRIKPIISEKSFLWCHTLEVYTWKVRISESLENSILQEKDTETKSVAIL